MLTEHADSQPPGGWLFPGCNAGQPIAYRTMLGHLRGLGLPMRAGRMAAVRQLVLQPQRPSSPARSDSTRPPLRARSLPRAGPGTGTPTSAATDLLLQDPRQAALKSPRENLIMGITITATPMRATSTRLTDTTWEMAWLPGPALTRTQAVTAMQIAVTAVTRDLTAGVSPSGTTSAVGLPSLASAAPGP
jgi:hypothetical protein